MQSSKLRYLDTVFIGDASRRGFDHAANYIKAFCGLSDNFPLYSTAYRAMSVTIVTGASRGLGAAICNLILQKDKDAKVVAIARSKDKLQELADKYGSRVLSIAGDVTDTNLVATAVQNTVSTFGKIDSVVLNAGVLEPVQHVSELDIDRVKRLYEVNVFSVMDLVKQTIPYVRETGGSYLFVSSGASTKATDAWSAYGSSKAVINHFCLSVSAEEPKIRTISIAPGVVDTEMQRDIRERFGQNMKSEALKRFTDLYFQNELLAPEVPAAFYANLALKGVPADLNGRYLRYNDAMLAKFAN
ncbi:hypothetical protein KL941_001582 [Ogataea angusta]|nr:hypothetical protein KL941_001582 [Ogataea angusta]